MADFNLLKRFRNETDGNVTVMFAISFTAAFLMIGAAFDIILLNKNQANVQYLADAAALSALQFDGDISEKEAVFVETVNAFAKASGRTNGIETSYINIEETETSLTLEATVVTPNELIMLQNVEGFDSFSTSTAAVIGSENIEIALTLDISSSMAGTRIAEAKKSASLFVNELLKDENLEGRISISLVPFGGTVRVPEVMIDFIEVPGGLHLRESFFEEYENKWIDGKWNQCFEFDISDIENGIDPNGGYPVTPDFWSWNSNNPWCPRAGSELVPLTDDAELLEERINSVSLSDGTGSDHGMAWAYSTLNDEWKNRFYDSLKDTPADNKSSTRKIIVFMTDGGITKQHFVQEDDQVGEPPFNSKRRALTSFNDSRDAFYSVCDTAKEKEIEIYTIGYQLNNNNQRKQLEYCATSTSHNISSDAGELENVFNNLISSISPLRVSN